MTPKFKPMDVVKVKNVTKHRLSIKEVLIQTCPGGTQITYKGRILVKTALHSDSVSKDDFTFLEHELEALPSNKETKKLEKLLEKVILEKEALIKNQDFEKAAEKRVEERKLKEQIEDLTGE